MALPAFREMWTPAVNSESSVEERISRRGAPAMEPQTGDPRWTRWFLGAVLVWALVWLGWGTVDVLGRRAQFAGAREPYNWRLSSREVGQLGALLEHKAALLPPGTPVWVDGAAGRVSDGSQLVLWAQYLAPELNWYWRFDLPPGVRPNYRLRWNLRGREPGWAVIGRRGRFVLEERRAPG